MENNKKYMEFEDVKLKQPLLAVKRAKLKNDTLIVPDDLINSILQFLDAENIEYHTIENPALYPKDKIHKWMEKYEADEEFDTPVLLITPFDAESLFEWSKQLYGETTDPSYQKYFDDQCDKMDEYYQTQYEYRPD